jgi:hypothetical protein
VNPAANLEEESPREEETREQAGLTTASVRDMPSIMRRRPAKARLQVRVLQDVKKDAPKNTVEATEGWKKGDIQMKNGEKWEKMEGASKTFSQLIGVQKELYVQALTIVGKFEYQEMKVMFQEENEGAEMTKSLEAVLELVNAVVRDDDPMKEALICDGIFGVPGSAMWAIALAALRVPVLGRCDTIKAVTNSGPRARV